MDSRRNLVLFLALTVIWGSGFAVIKVGQEYFPPVFYAALCFDVTAIGLLSYVVLREPDWRPRGRDSWLAVGAISLFSITAFNALFFVGQRDAPSAVGAIILSFIPVITAVLAQFLLADERFLPVEVIGLVVGLLGVGLIVRPTPSAVAAGDVSRLLILLAATCNALGGVLVQRFDPPSPTPVLLAWAMPPSAVGLHLVSFATESYAEVTVGVPAVLAVAYLALVPNLAGYLIFFTLLRRIGAFEVNLVTYFEPIVATILGWLVLSEQLDPLSVVGFLVIVVGFVLVQRDRIRDYVDRWDRRRRVEQ